MQRQVEPAEQGSDQDEPDQERNTTAAAQRKDREKELESLKAEAIPRKGSVLPSRPSRSSS